jgi:hypothetical protein
MPSTSNANGVQYGDRAGEERGSRRGQGKGRAGVSRVKGGGAGRRSSRAMTLAVAAREYVWLWDYRHGISPEEIATRDGQSVRRVRLGLARARAQEKGDVQDGQSGAGGASASDSALWSPRLIPMFPLGSYTPQSTCAHRRALRSGSLFCCMVCHRSGIDGHPALLRDPRTDPSPEPKPAPAPAKTARETRKQRRKRLFAANRPITNTIDA